MAPNNSCFVATVDPALTDKLKRDLQAQGFTMTQPAYTRFAAKKPGISVALYLSGKLTVQGKNSDEFIRYYLEPEILGEFSYSYPETPAEDLNEKIGSDEAGKGDYFGPLTIAACYGDPETIAELKKMGVKESKMLKDSAALEMADKLVKTIPYGLVVLEPAKYNELYHSFTNLNHLLAWGHAAAIEKVIAQTSCKTVLVDQFTAQPLVDMALQKRGIKAQVTQRPKADSDIVVACASLIARAAFLRSLKKLGDRFDTQLPKGATHVLGSGRDFIKNHGKEALAEVAKLHFKTTQQLIG